MRPNGRRRRGKAPRVIEIVLTQSKRIVRMDRGVLITETHHGFVCANAGVDASNVQTVACADHDPAAAMTRWRLRSIWMRFVALVVTHDAILRSPVTGQDRAGGSDAASQLAFWFAVGLRVVWIRR
jgi:F420-0:gamma-glutamyl ligase